MSEKLQPDKEDDSVQEYNTKLGLGPCQFQSCQWLNTPRWLLVFTSLYVIVAGMMISGFTAVAITSLETRFELRSTESGTLYSAYEVAAAIIGLLTSFYSGQGHKGRYLAASAIIIGVGGFIFALPHWITGDYIPTGTIGSGLCVHHANITAGQGAAESCVNVTSPVRVFLYVFLLAQVFVGAGNNVVWTTGMAYIDENVSPASSSVYIGVIVTLAAIGPAIGFLLGGIFLNLWVDWPSTTSQGNENLIIASKYLYNIMILIKLIDNTHLVKWSTVIPYLLNNKIEILSHIFF